MSVLSLCRPNERSLPVGACEGTWSPSDAAIITGIAAGQEWAADALYVRLRRVVDHTLCRILGRRDADFDDLVQVSFERVVRELSEGRFQGASTLSTWAVSVTMHVGIDALRARTVDRRVFAHSEPAGDGLSTGLEPTSGVDETDTLTRLEARSELERVQLLLAKLPQDKADTLFLHDGLGYDIREIAELTGSTPAAVQSRLVRGRKQFLELAARLRSEKGGEL